MKNKKGRGACSDSPTNESDDGKSSTDDSINDSTALDAKSHSIRTSPAPSRSLSVKTNRMKRKNSPVLARTLSLNGRNNLKARSLTPVSGATPKTPMLRRKRSLKSVMTPVAENPTENWSSDSIEMTIFREQEELMVQKRDKYREKMRELESQIEEMRKEFHAQKKEIKLETISLDKQLRNLQNKSSPSTEDIKRKRELRKLRSDAVKRKEQLSREHHSDIDLLQEKSMRVQQKLLSTSSTLRTIQQQIEFYLQNSSSDVCTMQAPDPPCAVIMTDIVSSTRIWQRDASVAMESLDVHNNLVRNLIQETAKNTGCSIIEVKSAGDSFMIACKCPVVAVHFCLQLQQRLLEARWPRKLLEFPEAKSVYSDNGSLLFRGLRVRCGVDYGDLVLQKHPVTQQVDYMGTRACLASRLESSSVEGSVAVSESVWSELKDREKMSTFRSFNYAVRDVGLLNLKGIKKPQHVRLLFPNSDLAARLNCKKQFLSKMEKEVQKSKEDASMWKERYQHKSAELRRTLNKMELLEAELKTSKTHLYQRLRKKLRTTEQELQDERKEKKMLLLQNETLETQISILQYQQNIPQSNGKLSRSRSSIMISSRDCAKEYPMRTSNSISSLKSNRSGSLSITSKQAQLISAPPKKKSAPSPRREVSSKPHSNSVEGNTNSLSPLSPMSVGNTCGKDDTCVETVGQELPSIRFPPRGEAPLYSKKRDLKITSHSPVHSARNHTMMSLSPATPTSHQAKNPESVEKSEDGSGVLHRISLDLSPVY